MDFDILFIGKLFPKEKEAEIKAKMKTGMEDAANALQWNIINGIDANGGTVKILDYLPVDSYPNGYTDRKIEEYVFQHSDSYRSDDKIVACTNLSIVKQFFNLRPFKREVKKWLKSGDPSKKVVAVYTASTLFLSLCKYVKRLKPEIATCCIIADLPEFSSARELHGAARLFNVYKTKKCAALYKHIDGFVLLTEQMAERLSVRVPFTVVEGIAPSEGLETDPSVASSLAGKKFIFYSGTLNYKFGIGTLLEAFSRLDDPELMLVICGFGEAEELIKGTHDDRIVFLGRLDRKQVLAIQCEATVLVNPRQNNEEFTKYSFPSKTMEYLASGAPLVAYKLDGIPDEYDEYIKYVPDDSAETLAAVLKSVCELSDEERRAIGERARSFVLRGKTAVPQAVKILELIKKITNKEQEMR